MISVMGVFSVYGIITVTLNDDTITVTVISQCGDCDAEIKRTQKEYSLMYFNELNRTQPNLYYRDANGECFMIVKSICQECQT